ncbi:hypothetical protein P4O66_001479 [Electrophorus voltai]|uniref:Uncharacterized protein n=1 Tax=Electrophorus voltai TaxID=2609070 RepID=A0AAD8Z9H7_9TELE|nr:hypothetical protein P4O66_001479 [Electrophorus voltai]
MEMPLELGRQEEEEEENEEVCQQLHASAHRSSPLITPHHSSPLLTTHHSSPLLTTHHRHSSLLTTPRRSSSPLITPHRSSTLITPHHSSPPLITPHHSSLPLITPHHSSPLLTAPSLLTTHHSSALITATHHSSPLLTSPHRPSSLLTAPQHSSLLTPHHSSPSLITPHHSSPLITPHHSSPLITAPSLLSTHYSSALLTTHHSSPLLTTHYCPITPQHSLLLSTHYHLSSLLATPHHSSPLLAAPHCYPFTPPNPSLKQLLQHTLQPPESQGRCSPGPFSWHRTPRVKAARARPRLLSLEQASCGSLHTERIPEAKFWSTELERTLAGQAFEEENPCEGQAAPRMCEAARQRTGARDGHAGGGDGSCGPLAHANPLIPGAVPQMTAVKWTLTGRARSAIIHGNFKAFVIKLEEYLTKKQPGLRTVTEWGGWGAWSENKRRDKRARGICVSQRHYLGRSCGIVGSTGARGADGSAEGRPAVSPTQTQRRRQSVPRVGLCVSPHPVRESRQAEPEGPGPPTLPNPCRLSEGSPLELLQEELVETTPGLTPFCPIKTTPHPSRVSDMMERES